MKVMLKKLMMMAAVCCAAVAAQAASGGYAITDVTACLFVGPRGIEPLTTAAALSNGEHRIVWDMNAQGLFNKSDKVVFVVSAEGKAK